MKFAKFFIALMAGLLLLPACEKEDMDNSSPAGYNNLSSTGPQPAITPDNRERYNNVEENPFQEVKDQPVSTFSIDADGASYSNVRRFLSSGQKPPKEAVRTEELINYFTYNYPDPTGEHPIFVDGEIGECPWNQENKLIRIGFKGKSIPREALPAANIVLLIDVSGSMSSEDKLPLLKAGFKELINEFRPQDHIAIVTYAGNAGVVLPATSGAEKQKIKSAIDALGAGGSTAGAKGIITAYEIAEKSFVKGGNNRVILATDGDFNVGPSSQEELVKLIESKRDKGIFLTVIGVGTGNLNDGMMEQVADKGNGIYEYIDNLEQARKVFVYEFNKFYTIAKDVKVQVQFSPTMVKAYRLIGYENRVLAKEDFTDDKKDAGELSSGQTITALYEIVPGSGSAISRYDPVFTIDFRYKQPDENISKQISINVRDEGKSFSQTSENMRFTASVAGWGMLLRDSKFKGNLTHNQVFQWASSCLKFDPHGYRKDFIKLVNKSKSL